MTTHAKVRTKRTRTSEKLISSNQHRRDKTIAGHRRANSRTGRVDDRSVTLLSKPFLDSINSYIRKIECSQSVHTFELISAPYWQENNSLDYKEKLIKMVDLPGLEDYDWNPFDFKENFVKTLNEHLGCTDIIVEDNDGYPYVTIEGFVNEKDCPLYLALTYEEMVWYFSNGYGLMTMILLVFLRKNRFLNDIAVEQSDMYEDYLMEEEYKYDNPKEKRDAINFSQSLTVAQHRINEVYEFLKANINLKEIADLIYQFEPFNTVLQELCVALCNLQDFMEMYENVYEELIDWSNIQDLIVWYGNEQQQDHCAENVDTNYGEEGIVVNYKGKQVDEHMIDCWNVIRNQGLKSNLIDTYYEILTKLIDESIITAFAGLCDKSDFVIALYRKLDGMCGGDQGRGQRWENLGVSPSFRDILKKAHRYHIAGQKSTV